MVLPIDWTGWYDESHDLLVVILRSDYLQCHRAFLNGPYCEQPSILVHCIGRMVG